MKDKETFLDAQRYRWFRKKLADGQETYLGETIVKEIQLDDYIDRKIRMEVSSDRELVETELAR